MYVYSFFSYTFYFIFYLLNIFKHLMKCNQYLNKFEIVIIFFNIIENHKKKKRLKEGKNQSKTCGETLFNWKDQMMVSSKTYEIL